MDTGHDSSQKISQSHPMVAQPVSPMAPDKGQEDQILVKNNVKFKFHIYLIPQVPTPHDIYPLTTILLSCF